MSDDDEIDYDDVTEIVDEFADVPTSRTRMCLLCGGPFVELEDDAQPPANHREAFGRYTGRCRGTRDPFIWFWCRAPVGDSLLTMPKQGLKVYFIGGRR